MFSPEGNPYFDVKNERQERYFHTIRELFGFGKVIEKSFITEHMIFEVSLVQEMLSEIQNLSGNTGEFYETIFLWGLLNLRLMEHGWRCGIRTGIGSDNGNPSAIPIFLWIDRR